MYLLQTELIHYSRISFLFWWK